EVCLSRAAPSRVGWASRPPVRASRLNELLRTRSNPSRHHRGLQVRLGRMPKPAGKMPALPERHSALPLCFAVASGARFFRNSMPMPHDPIAIALEEDIGAGDVTSEFFVEP